MKKIFGGILLVVALFLLNSALVMADRVNISLDGEPTGIEGMIVDGRTVLPARAIVEMLGGNAEWDGQLRQVRLDIGQDTILLTIDAQIAFLNGQPIELDVPAQIIEGTTYLPLRFVAESLGLGVDFDGEVQLFSSALPATSERASTDLIPSGRLPIDLTLTAVLHGQREEIVFYQVPSTVYYTLGSENGLMGTLMQAQGRVVTPPYEINQTTQHLSIETDGGRFMLLFDIRMDGYLTQYGFDAVGWGDLAVGLEGEFFVEYLGFSTVYDVPIGFLLGVGGVSYAQAAIDWLSEQVAAHPVQEPTQPIAPTRPASFTTYQQILDYYSSRLREATPGLIAELRRQAAANTGGVLGLAQITVEVTTQLAEISTQGSTEMAALMMRNGDDLDVFMAWSDRLADVFLEEASRISDVYFELVDGL